MRATAKLLFIWLGTMVALLELDKCKKEPEPPIIVKVPENAHAIDTLYILKHKDKKVNEGVIFSSDIEDQVLDIMESSKDY